MDVDKLITELQEFKKEGYGKLKVKFDFGACKVERVYVEENAEGHYIHLDWA